MSQTEHVINIGSCETIHCETMSEDQDTHEEARNSRQTHKKATHSSQPYKNHHLQPYHQQSMRPVISAM